MIFTKGYKTHQEQGNKERQHRGLHSLYILLDDFNYYWMILLHSQHLEL